MAFTGLAIAAALALAKDKLVDEPAAQRKRKLAAATDRYSPWTGQHGGQVNDPNYIGDAMSAGATGAMIGQGITNSNAQNDFLKGMTPSSGVDPNLKDSNSFMAGQNPYEGANAKLNADAGLKTGGYSNSSLNSAPTDEKPSWFFGNGPRNEAAGSLGSTEMQAKLDKMKDPYATLTANGIDPNPPSSYWNQQTNPYAGF